MAPESDVRAPKIEDEDINRLEQRWSRRTPRVYRFDDERRQVLKHMDSCEVQACPGSGKTTTLTAKLELLLEQWPETHQGICVLSHTNAARDEVVEKLGHLGVRLLRRPHFIGTIQSFVNHFLASQEAVTRFGARPWAIDDGAHYMMMRRKALSLNRKRQAFYCRQYHVEDVVETLAGLSLSFEDPDTVNMFRDSAERPLATQPHTETHQQLRNIKLSVAREGCLSFHDAYSLGKAYLLRQPQVADILARRFPFVFIDEMQDTDQYQVDVLRRIFEGRAVVQRFGDWNQSIYSTGFDAQDDPERWTADTSFQIASTQRLSASIARLGERMGAEPHTLRSESEVGDLPHTIFVFDDPLTVLPAYAALVAEHDLGLGDCVAVAAVAKPQEQDLRFTLPSYAPAYSGRRKASRPSFPLIWDTARMQIQEHGYSGPAYDTLFGALVQFSREFGLRRSDAPEQYHSVNSLLRFLKPQEAQWRSLLLGWLRLMNAAQRPSPDEVFTDVRALFSFNGATPPIRSLGVQRFLSGGAEAETATQEEQRTFVFKVADQEVTIRLGTIHSVKGQTHRATLLLESFRGKPDMAHLKPFLLAQRPQGQLKVTSVKALKLAYVAMTRPTHLLCVAMHSSGVTPEELRQLEALGWSTRVLGQ